MKTLRLLLALSMLNISSAAIAGPAPSFSLTVRKKSISVPSPTTASLTATTDIAIQPKNGFKDKVTLTANGAPPGVDLKLDPNPIDTNKSATLTITVGSTVVPGQYTIEITGQAGGTPQFAEVSLAVGVGGEFDLTLGVGSLLVKGDVTDYKVNNQNNLLQTTNLGRATPQLLAGAAFKLPFGNFSRGATRRFGPHPWYAFLSLKFSPDSSQTFSGYVIGGSYKLADTFSVLAGYALTPIQEPSPGFRTAAVQVVTQNPNISIYQRFNVNDLQHNNLDAFEGFPLFVQSTTGPTTTHVFDGDPTVVHYHGGFVIGVAVPISLKSALGGGK